MRYQRLISGSTNNAIIWYKTSWKNENILIKKTKGENKWLIENSNSTRRNSDALRKIRHRQNFNGNQNSIRDSNWIYGFRKVRDWQDIHLCSRNLAGRLCPKNSWIGEYELSQPERRYFRKPKFKL